jgi:hypothetical protein
MLKSLLASAALGGLLATGAFAQDQTPATDPAADPAIAPAADPAAPDAMAPEGTMDPAAPAAVTGDWVADEDYMPVDVAELTAEDIIGADIRNADGEVVATVDDVIFTADQKAESVAATFGGFLGFGSDTVLLTLEEVEFMQNDAGTVVLRTNVTPEDLEGRPEYTKAE